MAASSSALAVANDTDTFDRGLQALKDNKLESAVQLLGEALQLRIDRYGEDAAECASAYHQYGSALFFRAQEESDVFGAPLKTTVAEQGAGSSLQQEPAKPQDEPEAPEAKKNIENRDPNSAAAPLEEENIEGRDSDDEEGDEPGKGNDEEEEEEEEEEEDDMQLGWNMLEVARAIYERNSKMHVSELADVHMLLSDISTEQERFEAALEDLQEALKLLSSILQAQDRRLAEVHYKMAIALHSLSKPAEALKEIRSAQSICSSRLHTLKAKTGETAGREVKDLEAVLEDLGEKQEELEEAVREHKKMKESLLSVFKQAVGSAGPSGNPQSTVIDLGVVGQGKKRINLAPVAPQSADGASASTSSAMAKPKRTLDDLMGGPSECSPKFSFAAQQPATEASGKRLKTALQDDSRPKNEAASELEAAGNQEKGKLALPTFLQPGNVQAVYGDRSAGVEGSSEGVNKP